MNGAEAFRVDHEGRQPGVLLSFVLPVLGNMEQALACARDLHRHAAGEGLPSTSVEVIVARADASGSAGGREAIGSAGEMHDVHPAACGLRILGGHRPSRGGQMRGGAAVARGGLLVFHHPDNPLERGHFRALLGVLPDEAITGGAFYRDLGHCWPGLGCLMSLGRWWQRECGILYGDQTCFVRRTAYDRIGGMPDMVFMEDVEFSRRLRSCGNLRLLDPPVKPDMSRFVRDGRMRRKLENVALVLLYRLGVSPARLARIYQRGGSVSADSPGNRRGAGSDGRGLAGHHG